MASSSHTATSGVTCGRPSARTVQIQNSSAVSSSRRVWSHPVATASWSLNRASSSVTGSRIDRLLFLLSLSGFSLWLLSGFSSRAKAHGRGHDDRPGDHLVDPRDGGQIAGREAVAHHGDRHPVSMSAYAAEPFAPTIPKVEPRREGTPPGQSGL